MKPFFFITFCCILSSCTSLKNLEELPKCPKTYDCKIEVLTQSSLKIMMDNIGKTYVKIERNDQYHVIKYTYLKKGRPEIADDAYQELIYFQVPVDTNKIQAEANGLSDLKLITGKYCFCQDAGFEEVKQGSIELLREDNTYYIDLEFETEKDVKVKSIQTKVSF